MLPALIGISGHEVGAEEEAAIRRLQPAGFILFSRNIDSVEQVRGLTESLRKLCLPPFLFMRNRKIQILFVDFQFNVTRKRPITRK